MHPIDSAFARSVASPLVMRLAFLWSRWNLWRAAPPEKPLAADLEGWRTCVELGPPPERAPGRDPGPR